jgi:hypothetical protein
MLCVIIASKYILLIVQLYNLAKTSLISQSIKKEPPVKPARAPAKASYAKSNI